MAEAMVGGVEGVPDVPPAGELLVACAKAEAAARDNAAVSSKEVWSCFIGLLLFWLEHERTCSRDWQEERSDDNRGQRPRLQRDERHLESR